MSNQRAEKLELLIQQLSSELEHRWNLMHPELKSMRCYFLNRLQDQMMKINRGQSPDKFLELII